jgi:TP901 family phage tail tape measure protein
MPTYEATVSADMSGYTNSVQQAIALTKEYAAASEGLTGVVGRTGTRAIGAFNEQMGVTNKLLKANTAEAANYQQAMGKVSAQAVAAGKTAGDVQRATKEIARQMTGSIGSAVELVSTVQKMGFTEPKGIKAMSKAMVELSAATGEAGDGIASSLVTIQRSYDKIPTPQTVTDLGDALTTVSAKFGASASAVADFSKNIAPFTRQIGISQTATLGFATAFAKMGEDGYRSANVFAKVLSDVDKAVRDGSPTLGVYAGAMGKTYAETEKLAKANPTEFVLQFTEALAKQGELGIRTLEQLGLEGVRSQKSIKALTSSGDLRKTIEEAQKAYGTGTTAEAAGQQLNTINEQAAKMGESLKQVAANSGAPMLDWLSKLTAGSEKAADALASLTGSHGFQTIMTILGGGLAAGMLGAKVIGGAAMYGTAGTLVNMANTMGRGGAVQRGLGAISGRAGMIGGLGVAGMLAGQMTGMPGLNTLGTGAIIAASAINPMTARMAGRSWEFLTRDMTAMARMSPRQWLTAANTPEGRVRAGLREGQTGAMFSPVAGRFAGGAAIDQMKVTEKYMKELIANSKLEQSVLDDFKKTQGLVSQGGRGKLLAPEYARAASMVASGNADEGAMRALVEEMNEKAARPASLAAQTAGARTAYAGRQAASTVAGLATAPLMLGAKGLAGLGSLAMNPLTWAVGAPVAATAYLGYRAYQGNQIADRRGDMTVAGVDRVAEMYGTIAPTFEAVSRAGADLTGTFEQLSGSFQKQTDALEKGGEPKFNISRGEYAAIKAEGKPAADLQYQNYRVAWQTVGNQRTDTEAMAELASVYGTKPTGDALAAMVTDLKKMGKTDEEVNAVLEEYGKVTKSTNATLDLAAKDFKENKEKGTSGELFADVISRWVADNPDLSDAQKATEIVKMIQRQAGGLNSQELQRFASEAFEAAGMGDYEIPKFQGTAPPGSVGYTDFNAGGGRAGHTPSGVGQGKAGEGEEEPEPKTNEQILNEWISKYVGRKQTDLENKISAWDLMPTGGTLTPMQRAMQQGAAVQAEGTIESRKLPVGGEREWTRARRNEMGQEALEQGRIVAETITGALEDWEPDNLADVAERASTVANEISKFNGNSAQSLAEIRALQRNAPEGSAQAQLFGDVEGNIQFRQGIERMGMTTFGGLQSRKAEYATMFSAAQQAIQAGEEGPEVQAQYAEGRQGLLDSYQQEIEYMQTIVKARRDLERQKGYAQDDYERSRGYAAADYAKQVAQATEQFQRQQRYMQEDHQRQMMLAERDYNTTLIRAERDYNRARLRAYEDFSKQMQRRAEDLAKGMMDPFTRISVEQTWSGEGLIANLKEQQAALEEQVANLDSLRKAGVSQQSIDLLGLNDPGKAQQLDRFLQDVQTGGQGMADQLNQLAQSRVGVAGQLFSPENDINTRRMEEDYETGLKRMAEDRNTWLADAQAEYDKMRGDSEFAFQQAMERSEEGFDKTMQYMEDSYNTSMSRMEDAHKTSLSRMEDNFTATFEAVTSNYDDLREATLISLEEGVPQWNKVITDGAAEMRTVLTDEMGKTNNAFVDSVMKAVEKAYGKNGDMTNIMKSLTTLMGFAGTGGGPVAADFDAATTSMGKATRGGATAGVGSVTQRWGNPGHYGPSGNGPHTGVDIGVGAGTPLYAAQAAKVVGVINTGSKGYGLHVVMQDADQPIQYLYGHMSSVNVRVGQALSAGDPVGLSGNSGNSRGAHLHLEARRPPYGYGDDMNPSQWMWQGGIVQSSTDVRIGENVYPEAVIPLNQRGIDVLGKALERAFGGAPPGTARGGDTYISYTTHEDHSVNVNGPVEVVSNDPDQVARALERKARTRALISPGRRS